MERFVHERYSLWGEDVADEEEKEGTNYPRDFTLVYDRMSF